MLNIKNLTWKIANKVVLDQVSLMVKPGELVVLTGPNGAGKSSLARVVMGLEKVSAGEIFLGENNFSDLGVTERAQGGVSYAFQEPVAFKGMSVFEFFSIAATQAMTRVTMTEILARVGLAGEILERELNKELSGGERKKLEIASLLVRDAPVMIFDEPEAGVDLWSLEKLADLFVELAEREKKVLLLISHQEAILRRADRVILLEEGKVKKEGEWLELKESLDLEIWMKGENAK